MPILDFFGASLRFALRLWKANTLTAERFTALVEISPTCNQKPGGFQKGYSPIGLVGTNRASCRILDILGHQTKDGEKVDTPNEDIEVPWSAKAAELVFEPMQPLVACAKNDCYPLARVAFADGNGAVFRGEIVHVVPKSKLTAI